jgi:sugar phosphate permease
MIARLRSVYYGWYMLASATLLAALSAGLLIHGASVYFNPIRRDLGLTAANTSLIFTISRAQAGAGGMLFGWLADKFGARPLIVIGSVLVGFGFIGIQTIHSYVPFLLVYVLVISPGMHLGFGQTLLTAVNRWFVRRKAIALTTLLIGFSAGGALIVYPLGLSVEHFGWRETMKYSGIIILFAGLFLAIFMRHSPEAMGIQTDEIPQDDTQPQDTARTARPTGFTTREALRTKVFWLILAASTFRISAETGLMVHIIPIMAWKGVDEQAAAGLVSLFFLLSIPTRLVLGISGQKLPFQPLIVGGMACGALGISLVVAVDGTWVLYPFVVLLAIYEGSIVLQWLAVGNFFGRRSYGTLTGIMRTFDTVGVLIAPYYAGRIFDLTGEYTIALVTIAALIATSGLLYAVARRPTREFAGAR